MCTVHLMANLMCSSSMDMRSGVLLLLLLMFKFVSEPYYPPVGVLIGMSSSICCLQWCTDWKHDILTLLAALRMCLILDLVGITT